jgi:hypothetical protein
MREAQLRLVKTDAEHIILNNGTKWRVKPRHLSTASQWEVNSLVSIEPSTDKIWIHNLVNLNNKERLSVRQIWP